MVRHGFCQCLSLSNERLTFDIYGHYFYCCLKFSLILKNDIAITWCIYIYLLRKDVQIFIMRNIYFFLFSQNVVILTGCEQKFQFYLYIYAFTYFYRKEKKFIFPFFEHMCWRKLPFLYYTYGIDNCRDAIGIWLHIKQ